MQKTSSSKLITAIILTRNEEADLPRCLTALRGFANLVVVDSGSTDRTREVAEARGATVLVNPFESFGKQRNWALDHAPLSGDWTLFLDADEVATDAFKEAVAKACASPDSVAGYYCCWKMMLNGVWLKRSDNFPKWQLRLLRNGRVRFVDAGHGQKEGEVNGELRYLSEPYLHYGFSKGWTHWLERHNRYSSQEAVARLSGKRHFSEVFSRHGSKRNVALKYYLARIPAWPLLRFCYTYFLRGGFLEGMPGLTYCVNIAYYEYLIQVKMRELQWNYAETNSNDGTTNHKG